MMPLWSISAISSDWVPSALPKVIENKGIDDVFAMPI